METEQATKAQAVGDGATAIHGARLHLLPGLAGGGERPHGARIFRRALWGCKPHPPPEGDPRGLYKGQGVYNICPRKFPLIFNLISPAREVISPEAKVISFLPQK